MKHGCQGEKNAACRWFKAQSDGVKNCTIELRWPGRHGSGMLGVGRTVG